MIYRLLLLFLAITASAHSGPSVASGDSGNVVSRNSVSFSQYQGTYNGIIPLDFPYLNHCKFSEVVPFAMCASSFNGHIPLIVRHGSNPQVGRINTQWVITSWAVMKNLHSVWNVSEVDQPRGNICVYSHAPGSSSDKTIASCFVLRSSSSSRPEPAIVRPSLVYLTPKPFLECFRESVFRKHWIWMQLSSAFVLALVGFIRKGLLFSIHKILSHAPGRLLAVAGALLFCSTSLFGQDVSYFNSGFLKQPNAALDRAYLGIQGTNATPTFVAVTSPLTATTNAGPLVTISYNENILSNILYGYIVSSTNGISLVDATNNDLRISNILYLDIVGSTNGALAAATNNDTVVSNGLFSQIVGSTNSNGQFVLTNESRNLVFTSPSNSLGQSVSASTFWATSASTLPITNTTLGLVNWLKFDDNVGITAVDSVDSANGTFVGDVTWTPGKINSAIQLSASVGWVQLSTNLSVGNGAFSVSAWLNIPTNTTTGGIIWDSDDDSAGFAFKMNSGSPDLQILTTDLYPERKANTPIPTGQWVYVAATWDGSLNASGIHIYTNSVETGYSVSFNGTGVHVANTTTNRFIGTTTSFSGFGVAKIDDARAWSRVLSAGEITNMFQWRSNPGFIGEGSQITGLTNFLDTIVDVNAKILSATNNALTLATNNDLLIGLNGSNNVMTTSNTLWLSASNLVYQGTNVSISQKVSTNESRSLVFTSATNRLGTNVNADFFWGDISHGTGLTAGQIPNIAESQVTGLQGDLDARVTTNTSRSLVWTSSTNNLGTNVSAVTFYGALNGNATTATAATTATYVTGNNAALTNHIPIANVDSPGVIMTNGGTTSITYSNTLKLDAAHALSLSNIAASKVLRTAADSTVAAVTIGSGVAFDGTTLTATGSGGTVTSVGVAGANGLTVSGSPVSGSGTITVGAQADILTNNLAFAAVLSNAVSMDVSHALSLSNATISRVLMANTAGQVTNVASGAVAIDGDGTATTPAQLSALGMALSTDVTAATNGITSAWIQGKFPGLIVTNGETQTITVSNIWSVDATHYLSAIISAAQMTNTGFSASGVVTNDANGKLYTTPTLPNTLLANSAISFTDGAGIGMSGSPASLGGTLTLSATSANPQFTGLGLGRAAISGQLTVENDGVATTVTNSVLLTNSTAATVSVQAQYSPALTLAGAAWITDATTNRPGYFQIYDKTVGNSSGAGNNAHNLNFDLVVNGARTTPLQITGNGAFTSLGTITSGSGFSAASGGGYAWSGRNTIISPANGDIEMYNNAVTSFNRLILGPVANTWPTLYAFTNGAGTAAGASVLFSGGISVSNLTTGHVIKVGADSSISSVAIGAVPIDGDGSATTFGQINALAADIITNGTTLSVTFSNNTAVDATHTLTANGPLTVSGVSTVVDVVGSGTNALNITASTNNVVWKTANYTLAANDTFVFITGAHTTTMPPPSNPSCYGKWYYINVSSAGTNAILPNGAETFNGSSGTGLAKLTNTAVGKLISLYSNRTNWWYVINP